MNTLISPSDYLNGTLNSIQMFGCMDVYLGIGIQVAEENDAGAQPFAPPHLCPYSCHLLFASLSTSVIKAPTNPRNGLNLRLDAFILQRNDTCRDIARFLQFHSICSRRRCSLIERVLLNQSPSPGYFLEEPRIILGPLEPASKT